ncbi:filamentous hemagglutinin N-terminal domain-containing protein [Simiduia curdlanivorans]|uniref:Filamentous hemagglutinin N-terminal domain-containing protein n=1 Tax=Simiduia curdlanivorans TaxID=1492769 RepID=A0ABV8V4D2_9GAMM|nr:filamentous hemagglutinin N-terminal domain-containing protein [Simiduia curdlanivorans]MDN3637336.1 filamentous hemagglutinin N-terminal domain-containing protein [Simiduia curdlanivorans]
MKKSPPTWLKKFALQSLALSVAQSTLLAPNLWALPSAPEISAGDAQIDVGSQHMTIHQTSQRAVLEYQQFNLDANEKVQFIQPSASALTLNKVTGADASIIAGQLTANGHVYLVNPNGVFFAPTAQVDLAGLVVTTLDIDAKDFMSGEFALMAPGSGSITNAGNLHADQLLAFVAPLIENTGRLDSDQHLALINAEQLVITPAGQRTGFSIDKNTLMQRPSGIVNAGDITGQWVALSAQSVDALHNSVIDNSGNIAAKNLSELLGGDITLTANDVINRGAITATIEPGVGGDISISAERIYNDGSIDTSGGHGGGAIELIASSLLILDQNSQQDANAGSEGDGGRIINFSSGQALFASSANISATGGLNAGNGGFVEVSGLDYVAALGSVNTLAYAGTTGTYLIDPTDITISNAADSGGVFSGAGPFSWSPSGDTSNISVATLLSNLGTSNVSINTASGFSGTGNIDINDIIDFNGVGTKSLSLTADGNININAGGQIYDSDSSGDNLNLTLVAGGNFTMAAPSSIFLGGGTFSSTSGGSANISTIGSTNNNTNALAITASTITDSHGATTNLNLPGRATLNATNGFSALSTNLGAISITSVGGGASFTNSGNLNIVDLNMIGNATISVTGDTLISNISAVNNLTLSSTGSMTLPDAGIAIAGNINLSADDLGDSDRSIILNANNLTLNSNFSNGDLTVNANVASLDVTNSGANTLTLTDTDSFTLNNFAVTGGGGLALQTANDFIIGSNIDTDGNNGATLNFASSAGDLLVNASIGDSNTGTVDDVNIGLSATGNITMQDGTVIEAGSANISLLAGGNITLSSLFSTQTTGTAIVVNAGNQIIDGGDTDQDIRPLGGRYSLTAVNGIGVGNAIEARGTAADLINTGSGNIDVYNFSGTFAVRSLNSVGDANLSSAADITLQAGSVIAVNDLTLNAPNNVTLDGTGTTTISGVLDITAGDVNDGDRVLSLSANTFNLNSGLSGGDLTINSNTNAANLSIGTNNLTLNNTGALALNGLSSSGGDLIITASAINLLNPVDFDGADGSNFSLDATAGDLLINASALDSNLASADDIVINLSASNNITMLDSAEFAAYGGTITANTGTGDITLGGLSSTNNLTTAIVVNAGNRILDAGDSFTDVSAINGEADLTAVNGISGLELQVSNLRLTNTTSGDISITEADALILDHLNSIGATSITAATRIEIPNSAITSVQDLTLNSADLQLGDAGINNILGTLHITAQDIYDSDRAVVMTAPNLVISTALLLGDLSISGDVDTLSFSNSSNNNLIFNDVDDISLTQLALSGGDFQLMAGGNLTLANAIDTNSSDGSYLNFSTSLGDIFINAGIADADTSVIDNIDIDINAENNIFMADGTSVNAQAGTINLSTTNGDITLSALASTLTTGFSINLNAGNRILDGGDLDRDIQAIGGRYSLIAVNGINDLEVQGIQTDLINTGTGNITINALSNVNLRTLTSVGDTTINAGADIAILTGAVTSVQTLALSAGGNISIDDAGFNNIATSFTASASDIYDSDRSVIIDAPIIDISTSLAGGDSIFNTTALSATINKSATTNLLTLNKINNGNLSLLNSNTGSGDLTISLLNGDLDVNSSAAGLVTGGALAISANHIVDFPNDGIVTLNANTIDLTLLQDRAPLQLDLSTSSLTLNGPSATALTIRKISGDLALLSTSWNGDLSFDIASGNLILTDTGLSTLGDLSISAVDLFDTIDRNLTINSNLLNLNLANSNTDLVINGDMNNLSLSSAGSAAFIINDIDELSLDNLNILGNGTIASVGNLTIANGAIANVNNLNVTSLANIILSNTGISNINGMLSLSANDINDGDRDLLISAPTLTLNSALAGGDLNLTTNSNNISITTSARQIGLTQTGNLNLTLDNAGGSLLLQGDGSLNLQSYNADNLDIDILGSLQLPNTDIAGSSAFIRATDLVDLDRNVVLNSQQLLLYLANPGSNLTLNTSATSIDLNFAQNNLTVNSNPLGNTRLTDLDSDGYAVLLADGNFTYNQLQGGLQLENWLQASDNSADGIRAGMLGFYLTGGDIVVIDGARISAINTVDASALGGLDNNDQTALLFRQLDLTDTSYSWAFGDASTNNAIVIESQGGDILIDNFNNANINTAARSITLLNNVEMRAYNNLTDAPTGNIINRTATLSNATLSALASRSLSLLTEAAIAPPPPPEPEPEPESEKRPVDLDSVGNDSSSALTDPELVGNEPQPSTSVSQLLQQANGPCDSTNDANTNQKRCANQASINRFLNSLLIGGQLPTPTRESSQ